MLFLRSRRFVAAIGVALLTGGLAQGASAATPPTHAVAVDVTGLLDAYRDLHPGDFAGLDALDRELTGGGLTVQINGVSGALTGVEAQRILDARRAAQSASARTLGDASPASILAFTVAVYSTNLIGPPPVRRYSGYWDFPNSWAGQATPLDQASLEFRIPSCIHQTTETSRTYTYDNVSTNRGQLEKANGTSPIFGISDYEKAFVSQADHGYIDVTLANYCGSTQSNLAVAFDYEANQGASVTGFSASILGLSVSYSGTGQRSQRGTAPLSFSL